MENNESNYDLVETLIANSKRSKWWTTVLVVVLCLLSALVLIIYNDNRKKKQTIADQQFAITKLDTFINVQNRAVDSLRNKYDTVVNKYISDIRYYVEYASNNQYHNGDGLRTANELLYQMEDQFKMFVDSIKSETSRLRNELVEKDMGSPQDDH